MKKQDKIILVILLLLTFFRIVLQMRLPIVVLTTEDYDDALLQYQAQMILKMQWLGPYSQLTLSKNISYVLFLAFCYASLIPYPMLLALMNIFSAGMMCNALRPVVDKRFRYALYLLLLYSPVGFTSLISQRIYRNGILTYAVLLLFAGFIGMFFRIDQDKKVLLKWSFFTGITVAFFWFIKEDSIWILPFAIVVTLIMFLRIIFVSENENKEEVKADKCWKMGALVLPFFVVLVTGLLISGINKKEYGIFTTNDRSYEAFGSMMDRIFSIENHDDSVEDRIWVTNEMMEQAYAVSPTLEEIRPYMETIVNWTTEEGETPGDWICWKVRYAIACCGYYESAEKADAFCEKVNQELDQGFATGQLKTDENIHITSQMKGLTVDEVLGFLPKTIQGLRRIGLYQDCGIDLTIHNTGSIEDIRREEAFLGSTGLYDDFGNGDPLESMSRTAVFIANTTVALYQKLATFATVLAWLGFACYTAYFLYQLIKYKKSQELYFWLILCGVFLSAVVSALEVQLFLSWFETEMYEKFFGFYSVCQYPLLQLARLLAIYAGIKTICDIRKKEVTK